MEKEKGENSPFVIPVIANIHQQVLEAVSKPNALDMGNWHTCDTTHCRAGWVTTLAGKEGKELEDKTDTAFAAMLIYRESSPVRVGLHQFYVNNEAAMADMKRGAEVESNLTASAS